MAPDSLEAMIRERLSDLTDKVLKSRPVIAQKQNELLQMQLDTKTAETVIAEFRVLLGIPLDAPLDAPADAAADAPADAPGNTPADDTGLTRESRPKPEQRIKEIKPGPVPEPARGHSHELI